ncbi:MAG: hypothetical protein IJE73_01120 [Muribaculaceae bacterium]|nr:hypothetical protein [Muribaculaceae bacterium]
MVIRKQPIISWLLEEDYVFNPSLITVAQTTNIQHIGYLMNGVKWLGEIVRNKHDWGLPELLMPSFEKVMQKSAKSFFNIDHQLFQEFYEENECGILLAKDFGTIVYCFGENKLYVWLFKTINDISVLYDYFYFESTEDNVRHHYCWPSLINDPDLYDTTKDERLELYECVANLLITYLAVKKYAEVETIIVPNKTITIVEDTINEYKHKEKVRNESGQKVIIMDSRWFVKIINDNDIFVRGFFRLQNKKNELGEWYKELIFVDSFVRHGYHRNAKIEDEENG